MKPPPRTASPPPPVSKEKSRTRRRRNYYHTPKKGTKARAVLLAMINPKGLTSREGLERGLLTRRSDLSALLDQFNNTGGWDIRAFVAETDTGGPPIMRYRVVGRLRYNGEGYRSFISV